MQFSLRKFILIITAMVICTAMVGRITVGGSLIVSQGNFPHVENVLSEHRIISWSGQSNLGGTRVTFRNPLALTSVDDELIEDAKAKNYYLEIQYEAIMPIFSSTKIVNPDVGMFGR